MRALFTTQPGFGHLNPFLPYAVALREAGHEVRFASAPAFAEVIAQHGFPCVGIGEDFTWEKASEYFPAIDEAARAGRAIEFATFDISWKLWNPKAARDLVSLFERWRPDVIVRELAENGATIAGEAAGVPVVCAAWGYCPPIGTAGARCSTGTGGSPVTRRCGARSGCLRIDRRAPGRGS
jgi:UDP:flavonoid glycosyltransferase YjiC (YdhE family)